MPDLSNIEEIGDYFLTNSNINVIDLTPLKNVKKIEKYSKIEEINLSPLKKLESIGSYFLSN